MTNTILDDGIFGSKRRDILVILYLKKRHAITASRVHDRAMRGDNTLVKKFI